MRLDALTTTTLLVAFSLMPPLNAQSTADCNSASGASGQRCSGDDYRFPVVDTGPALPLSQLRHNPVPDAIENNRGAFSSPFPAAWVGSTRVELTSETNEWVTVTIEGIDQNTELSFTSDQATQVVTLEPGVYRFRFRPTLSNRPWQSGYVSIGRTRLLRLSFDQESQQVFIFDDPDAWSPDGSVGSQ